MIKDKKAVMGPVISVFVMVLVISILAGLTFLFVSSLKDTAYDSSNVASYTIRNETGAYANTSTTDYSVDQSTLLGFGSPVLIQVMNISGGNLLLANFSLSSTGVLTNASTIAYNNLNISYTYNAISDRQAYDAVNDTENAGATIVGYLPLIFLALIFGAILTLVLKIILPYINLGKTMGGDF